MGFLMPCSHPWTQCGEKSLTPPRQGKRTPSVLQRGFFKDRYFHYLGVCHGVDALRPRAPSNTGEFHYFMVGSSAKRLEPVPCQNPLAHRPPEMHATRRHVERALGRHHAEPVWAAASLVRVVLAWSKRGRGHWNRGFFTGISPVSAEAGVAVGSGLHVPEGLDKVRDLTAG